MVEPVFFLYIVIAIFCYGMQGSLQTTFVRRYDAFVVVVHRNISLILTMSPVLFCIPYSEFAAIQEHFGTLFLASATGAVSLISNLSSSKYLPIGIATAIRQMTQVTVAIILGVVFLHEYLTMAQFALLTGLVCTGISLAMLRSSHAHLDTHMAWRGLGLTFFGGVVLAHAFYFFSILAKAINPVAAGYFWEVGVGLFALLYLLILAAAGKHTGRLRVPIRDGAGIVGAALLTIPATVSYAFAITKGPFALAAGLVTMTTIVASVMGWVIYKEALTKLQISLIALAVFLMILLKVVS